MHGMNFGIFSITPKKEYQEVQQVREYQARHQKQAEYREECAL